MNQPNQFQISPAAAREMMCRECDTQIMAWEWVYYRDGELQHVGCYPWSYD